MGQVRADRAQLASLCLVRALVHRSDDSPEMHKGSTIKSDFRYTLYNLCMYRNAKSTAASGN